MTARNLFVALYFCCVGSGFAQSPQNLAASSAEAVASATWDIHYQPLFLQISARYEEIAFNYGANPTAANAFKTDLARRFSKERFSESLANMIASNMTAAEIASTHKFVSSTAGQKYFAVAMVSSTESEHMKKLSEVMSADELQTLITFFSNASISRSFGELMTPTGNAGSGSAYERVIHSAVPEACKALASSLSVSDYATLRGICRGAFVSPTSP